MFLLRSNSKQPVVKQLKRHWR